MKYLKNLSCLFALFLVACNSSVEKKQEQPSENEPLLQTSPPEAGNHSGNSFVNTVFNEDSSTIIRFQNLHLMVNYLVGEQDTFSVKATNPDTVAIFFYRLLKMGFPHNFINLCRRKTSENPYG